MNELLRFYLAQAIEFACYCVLLLALGVAIGWLWMYAPGQHPEWSIALCLVVGGFAGLRAWWMLRRFHAEKAAAIARAERQRVHIAAVKAEATLRRQAWSARIRRAQEAEKRIDAFDRDHAERLLAPPASEPGAADAAPAQA